MTLKIKLLFNSIFVFILKAHINSNNDIMSFSKKKMKIDRCIQVLTHKIDMLYFYLIYRLDKKILMFDHIDGVTVFILSVH